MKTKIRLKKLDMRGFSHEIGIVAFAVIFAVIGVGYLVASHADTNCRTTEALGSKPVCSPTSGPVSGTKGSSSGEQLSIPPQRRPAQYLHVCTANTSNTARITYVSQGTPNCLAGGTFKFNYSPTVTGTVYSYPCSAINTTSPRYVYVSSSEACPANTARITLAAGEKLSFPPAKRPSQYVHLCAVGKTDYVTQGAPNCLANGVFQYNYGPTAAFTYYSTACYTTNTRTVRYIYISSGETCPSGTALVIKT